VPDFWRRKNRRLPANRSFREIVNGTRDPLKNRGDAAASGGLYSAAGTRAFGLSMPRPMVQCAAVAIVAFCGSIYCAVGYVHYKHAAGTERAAAERTERANADLQNALDGMRDHLALAKARIDTLAGDAKPPAAAPKPDKADHAVQLTRALGLPDLQPSDTRPATLAVNLIWEATKLSDGHLQQSWVRIELNEAEGKIQQLSASTMR
jgi:hypothetical protein